MTTYDISKGDKAQEFSPDDEKAFISDWSLGNYGKCGDNCSETNLVAIVVFNYIALLLIILEDMTYKHYQTKKIDELEQKHITPSSF